MKFKVQSRFSDVFIQVTEVEGESMARELLGELEREISLALYRVTGLNHHSDSVQLEIKEV